MDAESSQDNSPTLDYDAILQVIGEFGKFQKIVYVLMCFPMMMSAYSILMFSFVAFSSPTYNCTTRTNEIEDWINATQCDNCGERNYDIGPFQSTLVSEFDMVCENQWKKTLIGSLYMSGIFFGCIPIGKLADRFGKQPLFMCVCLWMGCCNLACALATDYVVYAVFRFLAGTVGASVFQISFVLAVELVGSRYRTLAGFLPNAIFSLGGVLLGVSAYFLPHWRILQWISAVPFFVFLGYRLIVPESVIWLTSQGRLEEAQKIILKAAAFNGKVVPSHMLLAPKENTATSEIAPSTEALSSPSSENSPTSLSLTAVLKSSSLRKRLAIILPIWITVFYTYYALSLMSAQLSGNIFFNFELSMIVEIGAVFLGMFAYEKLGRSLALSSSFLAGSFFSFAAAFIQGVPIATLILSLLAKISIVITFAVNYCYTAEMFPTPIRSTIMGLCTTTGGLGSVASTISTTTLADQPMFLYLSLAVSQLLVGLTSSLLPETRGQPLPATLLDAEELDNHASCFLRLLTSKDKTIAREGSTELPQKLTTLSPKQNNQKVP